ncbi:MAG: hypothetical protein KC657_17505 [Myxococcales bacterium]|nr:hypothetical protein [Myxococcales bacterium]
MPTLASAHIPPPKSWEEFQDITLSALTVRWRSPNLQQIGRQGQGQAGVDIYGPDELGRPAGVQCKNTQGKLTLAEIVAEVAKAEAFVPALGTFFIATTARRDAKIQEAVRLLSLDRLAKSLFPVGVLFWEDLVDSLASDRQIFAKHYPQLVRDGAGAAVESDGMVRSEKLVELRADFLEPHLGVMRPYSGADGQFKDEAAPEWFHVRVRAPALEREAFEPRDERAFLSLVRASFPEDASEAAERGAQLRLEQSDAIHVDSGLPALDFHRRWAWWPSGVIGLTATLPDLWRPGTYSVPEMLIDMRRLLALVTRVACTGPYVAAFQIAPHRLAPRWDLSPPPKQGRPESTLAGVEFPGGSCEAFKVHAATWMSEGVLESLDARADSLVATVIVRSLKKLHAARVDSEALIRSIPIVLTAHSRRS